MLDEAVSVVPRSPPGPPRSASGPRLPGWRLSLAEGVMATLRGWPTRALVTRSGSSSLVWTPHRIPGIDADAASAGLSYGLSRFEGTGLEADQCLVPLDESAQPRIIAALAARSYDCVVIGGGIRKPEPLLEFFEAVVNLVRLSSRERTPAGTAVAVCAG
jgi:hypothetical protein